MFELSDRGPAIAQLRVNTRYRFSSGFRPIMDASQAELSEFSRPKAGYIFFLQVGYPPAAI